MAAFFKSPKASWIWLVLRLYLGYEWLTAGWEKIAGDKPFSAMGMIQGGIKAASQPHAVQPWWAAFLKSFAVPNIGLFNFLVPWGELLVGLALLVGFATIFATLMGAVMNFAYMLTGSSSTNPQMAILEVILIGVGGAYAGYLGVDYWFRPIWRGLFDKKGAGAKVAA